jgi:hypothetical protein
MLGREELESDARGQRVFARVVVHLEAAAFEIEHEERLAALRHRLAARGTQPRSELACRRPELARRRAAAERGQHEAGDQRHDREHHEELEQARRRGSASPSPRAHRATCGCVMSLLTPSPPSLPSAPSETMSYGPVWPGARTCTRCPTDPSARVLLPVRAVPVVDARRRADQRLQAFLRDGIAADLELEEIERLADLADLDLRGVGLRLLAAAEEVAADDAHHDAMSTSTTRISMSVMRWIHRPPIAAPAMPRCGPIDVRVLRPACRLPADE